MKDKQDSENVEQLLATPGLSDALESDRFKQFLDHVPVAVAVSELGPSEAITYCNFEFERLTGQPAAKVQGHDWKVLPGVAAPRGDDTPLGEAVQSDDEYIGTFTIDRDGDRVDVDAWSNTIESDEGVPMFRLVALASVGQRDKDLAGRRVSGSTAWPGESILWRSSTTCCPWKARTMRSTWASI